MNLLLLEKKSLSRVIWRAGRKGFLQGLFWQLIYVVSQIGIAFLLGAVISLVGANAPRVPVMSRVPPEFQSYFRFGQTLDRKDLVFAIPLLLLVFSTLKMVAGVIGSYLMERTGHWVAHALRFQLLAGYLSSPGNTLDRRNPEATAEQLVADTTIIQEAIGRDLLCIGRDSLLLFCLLLGLLKLAPTFGPLLFLVIILLWLAGRWFASLFQNAAADSLLVKQRFTIRVNQTLQSLLAVFGLKYQERELRDLTLLAEDCYLSLRRHALLRAMSWPFGLVIVFGILATLCFLRVNSMLEFNPTTFATLLVLFVMALAPIRSLRRIFFHRERVADAYRRLRAGWDEYRRRADSIKLVGLARSSRVALKVEGISYRAPDGINLVENCSLSIPRGLRVALIGESGSGKTTFLRLCAGLLAPTEGRVSIDSEFLLATQSPYVFKGSVLENIRYSNTSIPDVLVEERIQGLILAASLAHSPAGGSFFLRKAIGFLGDGLSEGEKARVALARGILAAPSLLLLDEPTAHLDDESAEAFWQSVSRWKAKDRENTMIAVVNQTLRLDDWDLVCVFSKGRMIRRGTPAEILSGHEEKNQGGV